MKTMLILYVSQKILLKSHCITRIIHSLCYKVFFFGEKTAINYLNWGNYTKLADNKVIIIIYVVYLWYYLLYFTSRSLNEKKNINYVLKNMSTK